MYIMTHFAADNFGLYLNLNCSLAVNLLFISPSTELPRDCTLTAFSRTSYCAARKQKLVGLMHYFSNATKIYFRVLRSVSTGITATNA